MLIISLEKIQKKSLLVYQVFGSESQPIKITYQLHKAIHQKMQLNH